MRALRPLAMAGAAALLGCGGSTTESSSDGRIQVTVSTVGAAPQTDEFLVSLDGGQPLRVAPNGTAAYERVPRGTYLVHLFSLADNCVVNGTPDHRSVEVDEGEVVQVTFAVLCSVPLSGGFRITVLTEGTLVDQDGYRLSVSTTPMRTIGVNAEEQYEGLAPHSYLISLKGVAYFCRVVGGTPQLFTVVPGEVVRVRLTVRCGDGQGEPLP
jgi:hypothetical protein